MRYQPPTLESGTAEHQARNTEPPGLREAMVNAVEHAPRRLAPGLGGSRYEHWRLLAKIPGGTDHFASLAVNMVMGRTPRRVMEAICRGKLTPFSKPDGGIRPISGPNALLRLVTGASGRHISEKVRGRVNPYSTA